MFRQVFPSNVKQIHGAYHEDNVVCLCCMNDNGCCRSCSYYNSFGENLTIMRVAYKKSVLEKKMS